MCSRNSPVSAWNLNGLLALFALATALSPRILVAQDLTRLEFQATDAEFLNPERGFYRYRDLTRPMNFSQVRGQGQTLIYGRVHYIQRSCRSKFAQPEG